MTGLRGAAAHAQGALRDDASLAMNPSTDQAGSSAVPGSSNGFTELVRAGCEDYVLKGIGLPAAAYVFHAVKLGLFVLGWMFFVSFTPGLGSPWRRGRVVAAKGSRSRRRSSGRVSSKCSASAA